MLRACRYLIPLGLICWSLPAAAHGGSYDQAVESMASELADFLKGDRVSSIKPHFLGLPGMPNGASTGFTERLKEHLAPHRIQISRRSSYAFVAHLSKVDAPGDGFALRLGGKVVDDSGKDVHKVSRYIDIDNAKDIAELIGVTAHFGSLSNDWERSNRIDRELRGRHVYLGSNKTSLFSSQAGTYGLEVRVGGQARRFYEPGDAEGLAFTDLELGEEYSIRLRNKSSHEVVVDLKIDGLNVFHFTETGERKRDGSPRFKYWVVRPGSTSEIIGWYKSSRRKSRFKITPVKDSAAALAGLPLDDVGQITATFHASWTSDGGRPRDEPSFEKALTVTRYVDRIVTLSDGRKVKQRVPVMSTRVGTGFGVEVIQQTSGVSRTVGVPRATIAFRYDRPQ